MSFTSLSFLKAEDQPAKKSAAAPGEGALPFANVLSQADWQELLQEEGLQYRERVFPPLVTLWMFVSQILSPDHSCRFAVAQWIASQAGQGKKPPSGLTSAYCRARERLPESFYRRVTVRLGQRLDAAAPGHWKWKERNVKIVDGSTLKLPDTRENQLQYPQRRNQKAGLGFSTARILTVTSLATGALLDSAVSPIQGQETGEPALLRALVGSFHPGDVLLFDRYYSGYFNLAFLIRHGVDVVASQHHQRDHSSMTEVKRFTKQDRLVAIRSPFRRSFSWEHCPIGYDDFSPALLLREITYHVRRKGFRPRTVRVLTTLLNPAQYSTEDILRLYAARWNIETDLLHLKCGLKMDSLRCKTPSMVRKEIWAHLMAYNFIRLVSAQAAGISRQTPRQISFQAASQTLQAFRPILLNQATRPSRWLKLYRCMLEQVSQQRIGNRPGRYEPRVLKRRLSNSYPFLTRPRSQARSKRLLNRKGQSNRYAKFARS